MPLTPNATDAQNSVTVRVPLPTPIQSNQPTVVQKPPEEQQTPTKSNRNPFKSTIVRGQYFPGGSFLPSVGNASFKQPSDSGTSQQTQPQPNQNQSTPTASSQQQPAAITKDDKWLSLFKKAKKIWKVGKSGNPDTINIKLSRLYDALIKYASNTGSETLDKKQIDERYRGPSYVPRKDESWIDENWQHVTSSNVESVAYNPKFNRLYVEFKRRKGGHAVYQYEDVPKDVHSNMMNAASKGKFVYYVLRNHGTDSEYAYRQID
jgi:hypothetical protein